jgi:hypothetical protein
MSEPINPVVLDNVFASNEDDHLPSGLHRLLQNKNGGSYICGATYDLPTKLRVADAIHLAEQNGGKLVVSRIAISCGVSDKYVNMVRQESLSTEECFRQRRRRLLGNKIGKVALERQAQDHKQPALLIVLYCMLFIQTNHQNHYAAIKSGYSILLAQK